MTVNVSLFGLSPRARPGNYFHAKHAPERTRRRFPLLMQAFGQQQHSGLAGPTRSVLSGLQELVFQALDTGDAHRFCALHIGGQPHEIET